MAKKPDTGISGGEKVNLLKQDLDLKTIMAMFSKGKTKKVDSEVLPDNSNINFIPVLPEVNMLPESVKETYAAEDLRKRFMIGGAALVLAFAGLWGVSLVTAGINQAKVDEIASSTASYQSEISTLAPYSAYRTQIESKRTDLASKMGTDIDVATVNNRFTAAARSAGYDINSVSLTISGADGAASGSCVNPDPFTPASGIGCLNFSLKDNGGGSMTKFFAAVNTKDSGFVNAYIPKALAGGGGPEGGATIEGSVSITQAFYTNKYESLTLPLDTILDQAQTPAEGK